MSLARRSTLLVVVSAAVFCGVAAAASTDPQVEIVPADQAWADSIVLTTPDLGTGWKARGSGGGAGGGGGGGDVACSTPDESDLTLTGGSDSPDFQRTDGAFVSSTAIIWKTPEQAQADWDRNVQPGLLSCLAAGIASASTKQIKIVVTAKKQLAYPALAPRTAAYRVSYVYRTTIKVRKKWRKISMPATFDFVALGSGRATAMLVMVSLNARRLDERYKQGLATMLAGRMATDPNPAPAP
jgi:hypothetical protein